MFSTYLDSIVRISVLAMVYKGHFCDPCPTTVPLIKNVTDSMNNNVIKVFTCVSITTAGNKYYQFKIKNIEYNNLFIA